MYTTVLYWTVYYRHGCSTFKMYSGSFYNFNWDLDEFFIFPCFYWSLYNVFDLIYISCHRSRIWQPPPRLRYSPQLISPTLHSAFYPPISPTCTPPLIDPRIYPNPCLHPPPVRLPPTFTTPSPRLNPTPSTLVVVWRVCKRGGGGFGWIVIAGVAGLYTQNI